MSSIPGRRYTGGSGSPAPGSSPAASVIPQLQQRISVSPTSPSLQTPPPSSSLNLENSSSPSSSQCGPSNDLANGTDRDRDRDTLTRSCESSATTAAAGVAALASQSPASSSPPF